MGRDLTAAVLDAVSVVCGPGVVSADMERSRLLRLPVSGRINGVVGPWSEGLHLEAVPDGAELGRALSVARAFGMDGAVRWVQAGPALDDELVALSSAAGKVITTRPVLRLGQLTTDAAALAAGCPAKVGPMVGPADGAAFDVLLRWIDMDVDPAAWRARGERQRVAAGAGAGHVWVARTAAMPVGVAGRWASSNTQVVAPVVVHQQWRRAGVASALLASAWVPGAWLFSDGRGWLAAMAAELGASVVAHLAEVRDPTASERKA